MPSSYFDQAAAAWDDNPARIALMKAVSGAILREARPTPDTDVLDYGCGTGLVSLFLLPYVRAVTGADSSEGMRGVLEQKIRDGRLSNMRTIRLDLESMPVPEDRYHLVIACMVLHHVVNTHRVLEAFRELLHADGALCLADLDTEPGLFHDAQAAPCVHHLGFDRAALKSQLAGLGFRDIRDATAHTIRKPVAGGAMRDFPVFLITARR